VRLLLDRVARLEQAMRTGVATLRREQQALVTGLTALRGVRDVTAITVVSELTTLVRFPGARPLMAYAGLVPREHSSGRGQWRGAITKTGNAHVRRVLVEAAWGYRHRPVTTARLRQRQQGQPAVVLAVAERAQHRLCARYRALATRGNSWGLCGRSARCSNIPGRRRRSTWRECRVVRPGVGRGVAHGKAHPPI